VGAGLDFVVVGAPGERYNGLGSGAAFVFEPSGAGYTRASIVRPGDGAAGDRFGTSLVVAEQRLVVGSPLDDDRGRDSGSVYVFQRTPQGFVLEAKLRASDGATEDGFGGSVAIDGERLAVGAPGADALGPESGAVYVFRRGPGGWVEEARLTAPDGASADRLGSSLALHGGTLAAAVPRQLEAHLSRGSVHVFALGAAGWTHAQRIDSPATLVPDGFGTALGLAEGILAVGAVRSVIPGVGASGSVYVYERRTAAWSLTAHLRPEGPTSDSFGTALAVTPDVIAVGAPHSTGVISDSGAVFVYRRSAAGWALRRRVFSCDGTLFEGLGASLAIAGERILSGAWAGPFFSERGSAYVFAVPPAHVLAHEGLVPEEPATRVARVSLGAGELQASAACERPALSANGRHVAFDSEATGLVRDDSPGRDVFVRDRSDGRVVCASAGTAAGMARRAALSADGSRVAFESDRPGLVPGIADGRVHVYVRDLRSGTTRLASVRPDGAPGNGDSTRPALSADGRTVAFESVATDLVPFDLNGVGDVFAHDLASSTTTRVSVSSQGVEGNGASLYAALSADGRLVAFASAAQNLVPDDRNHSHDVFVHDRQKGLTERVSVDDEGQEGALFSTKPALSADGRFVAFYTAAENLAPGDLNKFWDVVRHDRYTATTRLASVHSDGTQACAHSDSPSISGDGRHVAFTSKADNLVPADGNAVDDVFVHDFATGATTRVSRGPEGAESDGASPLCALSEDGLHVAFQSAATNLVQGDTNGVSDAFVADVVIVPLVYCSESQGAGCTPRIGWSGVASAAPGSRFTVEARGVPRGTSGLLLWGTGGRAALPFPGGILCVRPPFARARAPDSGGLRPCGGRLALDVSDFLPPGSQVTCQWWVRDPASRAGSALSDALEYTVAF
jgi:Tol biopolymer transport system component